MPSNIFDSIPTVAASTTNIFDDPDLGKPKRSALGEIANQGYAGAVSDLPRMVGKAAQYLSDPGQPAYEWGKGVADAAEARGQAPDLQASPEGHGMVVNALASGARVIPSVLPALAGGAAITAATGGGAVPLAAGAVAGAVPFALSAGQETLDKAKTAGVDDQTALDAARKNALITGAGATVGNYLGEGLVGLAGKTVFQGAKQLLAKPAASAAADALTSATSGSVIKPWAEHVAENAIGQTGVMAAQNAATTAVENQAGISKESPLDAAQSAIAPTLGMTALLAPFGLVGHSVRAKGNELRAKTLADGSADPQQRAKAAFQIHTQLMSVDPAAALAFGQHATAAIDAKADLSIGAHLFSAPEPGQYTNPPGSAPGADWTTAPGASAGPVADSAASPTAPDWTTSDGASAAREGGMDYQRDVNTDGLSLNDPIAEARARAATVDYTGADDTTPALTTSPGATPNAQGGLEMPREFNTDGLALADHAPQPVKPSEAMGLDPAAGPMSAAAALAVDSGAHQAKRDQQAQDQLAKTSQPGDILDPANNQPFPSIFAANREARRLTEQTGVEHAPVDLGSHQFVVRANGEVNGPGTDIPALPAADAGAGRADAEPGVAPGVGSGAADAGAVDAGRAGNQPDGDAVPLAAGNEGTVNVKDAAPAQTEPQAEAAPAKATAAARADAAGPAATRTEAGAGGLEAAGLVNTGAEVSRFNGKYGKGMGADAARLEARRLNQEAAGSGQKVTYAAEEHGDPKLENPYAVVGRETQQAKSPPIIDEVAHQAATSPFNHLPQPTDGQKEAGNYQKGHVNLNGLDLSIENPVGSVRSGIDSNGAAWSNTLQHHYGYIRGTIGNDKEHVDVFVKPGTALDYNGPVFVGDQVHPDTGAFDEHKVVIGARNGLEARQIYQANYAKGWKGLKSITSMPFDAFKTWVKDGAKTEPVQPIADAATTKKGTLRESQAQQAEAKRQEAAQSSPVDVGPVGKNSQPLSEGGKPFKTRAAAVNEKKLQPMMRVVSVEGGFALANKSEKQLAAEAKAARRLRNPQTSAPGEPVPAHAFIASEGGLNVTTKPDMNVGGNPRIGNRTLFAGIGKGLSMERATERLIEEGYLGEGASQNDAMALIKRSLNAPQYNSDGIERIAQAEEASRFDDFLAAQDEQAYDPLAPLQDGFTADDMVSSGYGEASREVRKEVQALLTLAEAKGIDTESIKLDAHDATVDGTQHDYFEATKSALQATLEGGRGDRGEDVGHQGEAGDSAGEVQGLTSPSKQDILDQQDRTGNAGKLDAKEQIDREAKDQTLTRQDAPEQRRDNSGDMFAQEKAQAEIDKRNAGKAEKTDPNQDGMFDESVKPEPASAQPAAKAGGDAMFATSKNETSDSAYEKRISDAWNQKELTDDQSKKDIEGLRDGVAQKLGTEVPAKAFMAVRLPQDAALNRIAGAFDKRVVGFAVNPEHLGATDGLRYAGRSVLFDGATGVKNGNVIYLRAGADRPHLALLGHELLHNLKAEDPALYKELLTALKGNVPGFEEFAKDYPGMEPKDIQEEFVADVVADGFMEDKFWDALGKTNPSLLERFAAALKSIITKVRRVMVFSPETRAYLKDYDAAMEAAGRVMAKYQGEHGDDSAPFSRDDKFSEAARNQATEAVENHVGALTEKWDNAPKVVVAFDMNDPRIPERVRQQDQEQRSGGAEGTPEGFYYKGTAYLMSSQLKTPADTARVLFHEVLGHAGLRGVFGKSLDPILNQLSMFRRQDVIDKAREYGLHGIDLAGKGIDLASASDEEVFASMSAAQKRTAAEEVLAAMAQTHPEIGFVKQAVAAIRTWLRENMPGFKNLAMTDDEIIKNYLLPARGFIERGQEQGASANPDVRFSRATDAIKDKLNERKSEIVGDTGRYTPEQRETFKRVGWDVEKPSLKERAQAVWKDAGMKLAQGIADQFVPIARLDKDAYMLMRLSKGASGAFETVINGGQLKLEGGTYNFDTTKRGGVIDRLLVPLRGEGQDFLRWVAANRADQLARDGKENLFTADDIKSLKTLADGQTPFHYTLQNGADKGEVTRDRATIYKDALATFNEFNKNIMDMAEQSGLIDGESRKVWEHEFYVPFYRVADNVDGGVRGMSLKSGMMRQVAFKQLKGGDQKLNQDLLANTLQNWAHLLDASAKNRAAKATLEAAVKAGIAIEAPESTIRSMGKDTKNKDGSVWFMDGGTQRWFQVDDPHVLTAINALQYAGMHNPIMNAMSTFKHAMTMGVTASPFFKVKNLARDSIQAVASGPLSYNIAKNLVDGWKLTDPHSDAYHQLMAGGGTIHFATQYEGSEARRVQASADEAIAKSHILDNPVSLKGFWDKAKGTYAAYAELGNKGEAINRAALYDQLIKQGKSHTEASFEARDLMDFSMGGTFATVRFLTQVVPFMNARIQGLYKLGKGAQTDPKRFSAVLGATAIMSLGLMAAYSDDDDWKKRTDSDRNNNWWFKFGGDAYRIPKPFEVGALATLAERAAELAMNDEETGARFRQQLIAITSDQLSMNPTPQMVKPLLEVFSNQNSFTGAPIESPGMQALEPDYRFNSSTTMAARGISTAANAVTEGLGLKKSGINGPSPLQADYLMSGYMGWLGSFIPAFADTILRSATNQPDRPTPDFVGLATGHIVSDLRDQPSRYVDQMYTQAKLLDEAMNTWKLLVKQGKVEEAGKFYEDHQAEIARHGAADNLTHATSNLNMVSRRIEGSTTMSGEDKRAGLRQMQQARDKIARSLQPV